VPGSHDVSQEVSLILPPPRLLYLNVLVLQDVVNSILQCSQVLGY